MGTLLLNPEYLSRYLAIEFPYITVVTAPKSNCILNLCGKPSIEIGMLIASLS
jgi:hypothetical protein